MTQRTSQQNKALHLGCELIADSLNSAGLDMRKVLKPEICIPWTTESVKEHIFRPIMILMTNKRSTTELDKVKEIDDIWEVIMRFLMEHHHVDYIPFPHDETKSEESISIPKRTTTVEYPTDYKKPLL